MSMKEEHETERKTLKHDCRYHIRYHFYYEQKKVPLIVEPMNISEKSKSEKSR